MARKHTPLAICYDFDGTLSPGYMQNYDFIPKLGMKSGDFWSEVRKLTKDQHGDEILIYMGHMLRKADQAGVSVKREAIEKFGESIELFEGVESWFTRINEYARQREVNVQHFIISSGLREMIQGTKIGKQFTEVFASGFWYDHEGVARFPALGVNYTTKTQYLFRINKGSHEVWDKDKVNGYVPPDERPVPFKNMVFFGDGETDIPCFRLVKDLGGHSIAVYKPRAKKGGKGVAEKLIDQGRVNFAVPANYAENCEADLTVKAIIDKIAADAALKRLGKKE
ncbi:HAD family hydrolase [Brucella sp. 2280]|uniref:HAD family hydrolase n=1 Tax=Brucella sp. 2280 TaxID=2592625 RepID=UPI001295B987|nr:HAD family hydrolase [Brucella sp. 2280]QGA58128.1 haloacid dehalogenase-like hydrolase [Brucella sp. 2280]